ncbi:OspB, partial [Escherichia coli]|nr:OspB [Escherichia coli]
LFPYSHYRSTSIPADPEHTVKRSSQKKTFIINKELD